MAEQDSGQERRRRQERSWLDALRVVALLRVVKHERNIDHVRRFPFSANA